MILRHPLRIRAYSTRPRPLKACIIGSGPAGFYTAYRLQSLVPSKIDIYESLPVPYGLARFGVAPDHPEVKNVTHKFNEVASSPDVRFFGNVKVGVDVSLTELRSCYDVLVFAYGASLNKSLNIDGESLDQVVSARSFVGWYNGLPEHSSLPIGDLLNAEDVVIIGHGNVALDIARTLLTDVTTLRSTDIADHALSALSRTRVKSVKIVGRRGPLQASFTIKEVRELCHLPHRFVNSYRSMYLDLLKTSLQRPQKRLLDLLASQKDEHTGSGKEWDIEYLQSPVKFNATNNVLSSITMMKNELRSQGGRVSAVPTGETHDVQAQLAFLSIGYQSEPIRGMSDIGVVFDTTRHVLPNIQGRVMSLDAVVPRMYCAGWAKLGPVGVIASTMRDAFETADCVVADYIPRELDDIESLIRKIKDRVQVVDWDGWKRIEAHETRLGVQGDPPRPAVKITDTAKMLQVAASVA